MKIHPASFAEYQQLVHTSMGKQPASLWFRNARFLNVYTGEIEQAHIYLAGRRIAYVGNKELPAAEQASRIIDLEQDLLLAPGYIEPHTHPCQLYNPFSWAEALLTRGTVASVNDNLTLLMLLGPRALEFIDELDKRSAHLCLWWYTFDSARIAFTEQDPLFARWLTHPLVLQGGEFTAWSAFLKGDPELMQRLFAIKQQFGKRVEGHLPAASSATLNALTAAGIGADHESLNGDDILKRLRLGLYATLRYSSIRPDLPDIMRSIIHHPGLNLSRLMLTSDGPAPFFVEQSSCANMLALLMEAGLPPVQAYRLATLNPATYYGLDEDLGGIAPGRLACLNVLSSLENPVPVHVMQEGEWVVRDGQRLPRTDQEEQAAWLRTVFPSRNMAVLLRPERIQANVDTGIALINDVITRPYVFTATAPLEADECFLSLIDAQGEWRVHTRLKGFSTGLLGLASTYSASTEVLVVGRDRASMCQAVQEVIALGGGIVALFADGERFTLSLPLSGIMSLEPMQLIGEHTLALAQKMRHYGYPFQDPSYTLLFLTATHLPFVRLTSHGVLLIKEQRLIAPHPVG